MLNQLEIYYKVINRIQSKILSPLEELVWKMLKYSVLIERESESIRSPLVLVHGKLKVLLAACYTELGLIKYIRRQEQLPDFQTAEDGFKEDDDDKKDPEDKDEILDEVKSLQTAKNSPLHKFLNKLTIAIQKAIEPMPQRLESFEKAEAILLQAQKQLDPSSFWSTICQIELSRVMRLLAQQKGELRQVWPSSRKLSQSDSIAIDSLPEESINQRIQYKDLAFKVTRDLARDLESKTSYMLKKTDNKTAIPIEFWIFQSKQFNVYLKMLQEQFIELTGQILPEVSFEYLAKFQHFSFNDQMLTMIKQAFFGKHKLVTYIRFNKMIYQNLYQLNQDSIAIITNESYRLWQNIMLFPDYKEIVTSLLPNSSGYLIMQMSQNKQFLYFGYMQNLKQQIPKYVIERVQMQESSHKKLQELKQTLTQIKTNLIKTPIIQESDFLKLEDDMEKEYIKFSVEMAEFFSFLGVKLDQYINQPPEVPEEAQEQLDIKQQKQPAKAPDKGKKAGKDEFTAYESPLEPSPGGVETLVITIDSSLFNFPLEYLPVFSKIRAISRDFSLLFLGRRLKNINFQPPLNNAARGIDKDKLKFITYDFKEEEPDINYNEYNSQNLLKDIVKVLPPAFKLEGVYYYIKNYKFKTHSSQRLASLGELQKYSSTGSALFYFGSPGILNILTPKVILDLSEINQLRFWGIFDKMNAKKTLIDKFTSLDPDGEKKTPILEQQFKVSAFLSLIDVATIFTTQWAPQTNEFLKAFESMIKGISEEIYISATLRKYKEPQIFYEDINGNRVDQKLIEASQSALTKDAKKGGKQQQQSQSDQKLLTEEDLKNLREVSVNKKKLYTENFIFLGIPVLRAF